MEKLLASLLVASLLIPAPGTANAQAETQAPAQTREQPKTTTKPRTLEQAVASFQENYDYASLKLISKHLKVGMTLAQVEAWLGEGDMPVCGQYRWASDREEYSREAERDIVVGLVASFECTDGEHVGGLKSWGITQIAE